MERTDSSIPPITISTEFLLNLLNNYQMNAIPKSTPSLSPLNLSSSPSSIQWRTLPCSLPSLHPPPPPPPFTPLPNPSPYPIPNPNWAIPKCPFPRSPTLRSSLRRFLHWGIPSNTLKALSILIKLPPMAILLMIPHLCLLG